LTQKFEKRELFKIVSFSTLFSAAAEFQNIIQECVENFFIENFGNFQEMGSEPKI
jgi:hypothetical protein